MCQQSWKKWKLSALLNQELKIGGHKIVHASYVSDIFQILFYRTLAHMHGGSRRLCMLNQSVIIWPFVGSNVITSQRCVYDESPLELVVKDLLLLFH